MPVPDGAQAGKKLDKALFEKMKDEYYSLRGWDLETGYQKESTLKALDMKDIAKDLKKMKKLGAKKKTKEGSN